MAYQQIENYGIIGDMHTVALCGINGSIDWFCFPHFDSPSIFAAILDDEKGGFFRIEPIAHDISYKQFYWPDTNVLVTRFLSKEGVGEIIDFMPVHKLSHGHKFHQVIRMVTVVRGTMKFRMECRPAFNYAMDDHKIEIDEEGALFYSKSLDLRLAAELDLQSDNGGVVAEFELNEEESHTFSIEEAGRKEKDHLYLRAREADELFNDTVRFWRNWLSQCNYRGRWREMVFRSALTLKLLTYEPTGAIVAAPTCSLPEDIGGIRNWDYRYTWLRDAAFTLYAFMRIGFTQEASQFMQWLTDRCNDLDEDGSLQIMYSIHGDKKLDEKKLPHLSGYKNSGPVRIGNGAYNQLQLDIYGELMDSVYLYNKYGAPISYDLWTSLRRLTNYVCANWNRPDEGIWEVRGGRRNYVYSKLMCWVALDRAIRLANKRSLPADHVEWLKCRDSIYQDIWKNGWSEKRQSFVQSYENEALDAANLIMPLVFFVSPTDPRMLQTLAETMKSPSDGGLVANSLVYRYNLSETEDGLSGHEGTFNICTFWLVEALTRASVYDNKRLEKARLIFEKMLGFANHLGLYAEEIGYSGEALGNFPQAFTHLSLISAAYNLDKALSDTTS